MKKMISYNLLLFFLLLASTMSCKEKSMVEKDVHSGENPVAGKITERELPRVNVKISQVATSTLREFLTLSGETTANQDITYAAELAGKVESFPLTLGQKVQKGQLIAQIDFAMLKAEADQAQAMCDLAEKTFNRLNQLKQDNLISQQQLDEAEASFVQGKTRLEISKINLNKSTIVSGIEGLVARMFVEKGEYLGPGMPIVQIVDFRSIVVIAHLPEKSVSLVERGTPVSVRIDALGRTYEAKVKVVLPVAEGMSKTYQVRLELANTDYAIKIGMAATVRIMLKEHRDVIVVPQEVVIEDEHQRTVFVTYNGIAHKKLVELGPTDQDRVVLTSGIAPGDSLVVTGQRQLVDGQPITIVQ